ncbi:DUF4286 family protein [Sphingosinicella soli]|uniref:DUF4286 domain-containing protein n=1 Tax=Sphingosinicella soli TaxID=333708 RepID=A0A7W7B0X6_9SPHN|nr:DUF4286 family protein [Sphingosinicella soli]MBB4632004.1 hypothetical protein [Sphingosinicella soli]
MPTFKLVVLSNAVEGQDDVFNDWYDNTHLQDVLACPGFVSAQRFKLEEGATPGSHRYLAIYDVDAPDMESAMKTLAERAGTSSMGLSDTMAPDVMALGYRPTTPLVLPAAQS